VTFAKDRVVALAPQQPKWRETELFKSILAHDREAMLKFSIQDFERGSPKPSIRASNDWKTIFLPAGTKQ